MIEVLNFSVTCIVLYFMYIMVVIFSYMSYIVNWGGNITPNLQTILILILLPIIIIPLFLFGIFTKSTKSRFKLLFKLFKGK